MPKKKNSVGGKEDAIIWTPYMDDALIDAFAYQNNIGNRVGGTFTTKAYDLILKELCEKFSDMHFDKEKLKNRLKYIKKGFGPCFDIFKNGLSGFAWNAETSTWCAEIEVWQKLIEVHPEAAQWMNKPIRNYNKLASLFGKDRATGDIAETPAEAVQRLQHMKESAKRSASETVGDTIDEIDMLISESRATLEGYTVDEESPVFHRPIEEGCSSNKKQKIRKVKDDDIVIMQASFKSVADAIKESTTELVKSNQRLQISESEIWTHLGEIGLDEETTSDAYLLLTENPSKLGAFLGCPIPARKSIMLKMLHNIQRS